MSLLQVPPSPPTRAPVTSPTRPGPWPRRLAIAVAVLLVVAGGVLAVVHALDAAALTQVHVFLDANPITCADPSDVTTVSSSDDPDDHTYRVPAVKGALGLDCVLSVVIRNGSDRDIDLQAITLPFFGPKSAMGVRSDHAQTQQAVPAIVNDGRDVAYTWHSHPLVTLGAGATFIYKIHLTSDGCRQAGSTFISNAPTATVTTGAATREAPLDGAGFGMLGVKTAAQPCH